MMKKKKIGATEHLKRCFMGYKIRVPRYSFWHGICFIPFVAILPAFAGMTISEFQGVPLGDWFQWWLYAIWVPVMIVQLPLWVLSTIGRLHDLGHRGWWVLAWPVLMWLSVIGPFTYPLHFIANCYLGFWPSQKGENQWGKNPHAVSETPTENDGTEAE